MIQLPTAISAGPPRSLCGIPYRLDHPAGIVKVTSAGVAPPAAHKYVPGATSSLTPGNSGTAAEAAAVGVGVEVGAGLGETDGSPPAPPTGLAEAAAPVATPCPVAQPPMANTTTTVANM